MEGVKTVAKADHSTCSSCVFILWFVWNHLYDIFAATISILDLLTDLWVMINFYNDGHTHFFTASLCIVLFAQVAYVATFIYRFSGEGGFLPNFLMFFVLFLISPFLSFVFMLTTNDDEPLARFLTEYFIFNLDFSYVTSGDDSNERALTVWMKKKIDKHIGFILEAICEAFPQSILQMIAIVTLNNDKSPNIIAIVSILMSMCSVASKSFVFSVAASYNYKTLILSWLSAVTDFFSIFFVVSWVFYNVDNDDDDSNGNGNLNLFGFNIIGQIWFFKVCICILPLVIYGSIGCYIVGYSTSSNSFTNSLMSKTEKFMTNLGIGFIITLLWYVQRMPDLFAFCDWSRLIIDLL